MESQPIILHLVSHLVRSILVFLTIEKIVLGRIIIIFTERGGSVVMHETRIREVPGSNPVAGQPG